VLTHGFTVDEKGRKMSKSLGNVIEPQKVMSTLGADVLRLWIAATDYAQRDGAHDEILKRISESYRRMRNTVRFCWATSPGFDPATDAVEPAQMVAIDRWALARTASCRKRITAYREYQYHLIYQKVHNFCVVDLGASMSICSRIASTRRRRRASRAALRRPRCFTSPRAWCAGSRQSCRLPPTRSGASCPASAASRCSSRRGTVAEDRPRTHRLEPVHPAEGRGRAELEKLRVAGTIGGSLDAEVEVFARMSSARSCRRWARSCVFC
jgi:isoleucyl-tRNA synthetase